MPQTWISAEMDAALGRPMRRRMSLPVSLSDIRRWAIAVYYPEPPPPLYWDEDHARSTVHGGVVAPQEFNPFAWITAAGPPQAGGEVRGDAVGPEAELGIARPATSSMLNGGMECTYGVRMRPGDVITSVVSLAEYREAAGRLGLMLFTVTEDRWTNQEDQHVKTQRDILIRY